MFYTVYIPCIPSTRRSFFWSSNRPRQQSHGWAQLINTVICEGRFTSLIIVWVTPSSSTKPIILRTKQKRCYAEALIKIGSSGAYTHFITIPIPYSPIPDLKLKTNNNNNELLMKNWTFTDLNFSDRFVLDLNQHQQSSHYLFSAFLLFPQAIESARTQLTELLLGSFAGIHVLISFQCILPPRAALTFIPLKLKCLKFRRA